MFVGVKMIVLVCKQVLKTFFSQLNTIFGFLQASNLTSTIYFSNACMQLYMDNESCMWLLHLILHQFKCNEEN